jgi:hypothetical protein
MAEQAVLGKRVTRELVLVGEDGDPRRRGDKNVIAMSQCRFDCPDEETLRECVSAIRRSDEHLRNRPEEMMLWDWQNTQVERLEGRSDGGGTVLLGVAWYDRDFFSRKREAHMDRMHRAMYEQIGLPPDSITVTHWQLEGEYRL